MEAQSLAVKRAEVEFHNFASLGEPERAMAHYAEQNVRRAAVIRNHLKFIGEMTPFLEIGSNVGHTSYMLANEFGARGFALDISADSLRHGVALQDRWRLSRAPIRVAGDAVNLPFRRRIAAVRDGVSDAQPVHEYRERLSGSEARAGAGRDVSFRRRTAQTEIDVQPVPLSLLRHHEAVGAPLVRLGAARISGARRDWRAPGRKFRNPAEPFHGTQGMARAD